MSFGPSDADKKRLQEMEDQQQALLAQQQAQEFQKRKQLNQERIAGLKSTLSGFGGGGGLMSNLGNTLG